MPKINPSYFPQPSTSAASEEKNLTEKRYLVDLSRKIQSVVNEAKNFRDLKISGSFKKIHKIYSSLEAVEKKIKKEESNVLSTNTGLVKSLRRYTLNRLNN